MTEPGKAELKERERSAWASVVAGWKRRDDRYLFAGGP